MGGLITEGEQLYRKWKTGLSVFEHASAFRQEVMVYLLKTDPVISDAIGDDKLPQPAETADQDELLIKVREIIDALYVVREERGRAADSFG